MIDTTKIIKGVVNGRNYTVTSPIVKDDYGLYLQIEGAFPDMTPEPTEPEEVSEK